MMMARRRLMQNISTGPQEPLVIYDSGTTADGYYFTAGNFDSAHYVGWYGAQGSNYTNYFENNTHIYIRCYDTTSTGSGDTYGGIRGVAVAEVNGLKRSVLKKYTTLNFLAMRGQNSSGIQYQHVGLYSSITPTASNAVVYATPEVSTTTFSQITFNVSDILSASDNEMFYLGGGCLTRDSYTPGKADVYIGKIWLE